LNKKILLAFLLLPLAGFLTSCAHSPVTPTPIVEYDVYMKNVAALPRADVYHVVGPSETLWRIAKMYDVDMWKIADANRLKDKTQLDMGQRLLIPDAAPIKPIIPLYKSSKWKYIIIHHSATDEGSALRFHAAHRQRGWQALGYHFVIDNGSQSKKDGQIEVAPRWIKQQDGAHCNAGGMNHKGIGICLVGNFSKDSVSVKQMESLVSLVNMLRNHYKIPVKNILGHGQVRGARTECPGKKFPYKTFFSKLSSQR